MSTLATLTPKSEESLKRLAKQIVRDQGVRHAEALDLAAQQAGVSSYKAFRTALCAPKALETPSSTSVSNGTASQDLPFVRIKIVWRDKQKSVFLSSGTVEIVVPLQRPLADIIPRPAAIECPRIERTYFKDGVLHASITTRELACTQALSMARTLQFMDATGFRASRWPWNGPWAIGLRERGQMSYGIPGTDHPVLFRDPETKKLLYINEPYQGPDEKASARRDWEEAPLFDIRPLDWGNLYVSRLPIYPELVSLKGKGIDLDMVEERLRSYRPILQPEALKVTLLEGHEEHLLRSWRSETHPGICAIA